MKEAEQLKAYEEGRTLKSSDGTMYKQEPLGVYYILTIFKDNKLPDGFYSHLTHLTYTTQVPELDDLEILDD